MPSKPSDQRAYVRIAVELPHHPKIAALDDPISGWAYIVAICYCGEHLTDGVFPTAALLRTASASKAKADKLIRAGLWHGPGHDCGECPQPPTGHAVIHDYLKHQQSRTYVHTVSQTRSAAGRKGAAQRWQADSKRHSNSHDPPPATTMARRQQAAGGVLGNSPAEGRSKNPWVDRGEASSGKQPARERDAAPRTAPTSSKLPSRRCAQHRDLDQDPGPCRGCMKAREHAQQCDRDRHLARVMAVRSCSHCDAEGWRYEPGTRVPLTPYQRCNHRPLRSVS